MLSRVTSNDFLGLVNPYTGKPMVVFMSVYPNSEPMFTCPDTYSTADRKTTREELYRGWNSVNGIEGGRHDKPIVCAYTGEPLAMVEAPDGSVYYKGGFDPHMFYTRDEFLYYATMRNGVAKRPKPSKERVRITGTVRRGAITDRMKKHADAAAVRLDEDDIHAVEKSMEKFKGDLPGSSTVSMSVPRGKKRGRRG